MKQPTSELYSHIILDQIRDQNMLLQLRYFDIAMPYSLAIFLNNRLACTTNLGSSNFYIQN